MRKLDEISARPLQGPEKAAYVGKMFAGLVDRYDLMNRVMSLGQDVRWRELTVEMISPCLEGPALDMATGTGDLAIELAKHTHHVVGLDFVSEMLDCARYKAVKLGLGEKIEFVLGDALMLPFPDNSFDCAVTGFAMRNVISINQSFSELRRVLKPGGRVACLELTAPQSPLVAALYRPYLDYLVPVLGRIFSGHGNIYTYMARSLAGFPDAQGLKEIMREAGLQNVKYRLLNFGTIAIHIGVK